jgi:hypothetical protein
MPGINRQVYRLLGQLKLTNGIGSVATVFQPGARRPPQAPSQPRTLRLLLGHRPDGVAAQCSTTWNYSVIDNLAPQQGFLPSAPSEAEEQIAQADVATNSTSTRTPG